MSKQGKIIAIIVAVLVIAGISYYIWKKKHSTPSGFEGEEEVKEVKEEVKEVTAPEAKAKFKAATKRLEAEKKRAAKHLRIMAQMAQRNQE